MKEEHGLTEFGVWQFSPINPEGQLHWAVFEEVTTHTPPWEKIYN